jgi:hypothetical protein
MREGPAYRRCGKRCPFTGPASDCRKPKPQASAGDGLRNAGLSERQSSAADGLGQMHTFMISVEGSA